MSVLPVHIEDVTVSTNLNVDIPLNRIVTQEEEAEYDGEGSDGVVYRMDEPKATALIFSSGKIVCTGAKSIREAEEAVQHVAEKIKELGAEVPHKPEMVIEKIVAAFRLKDSVNLQELASRLEGARYDTEKLPAVVYRPAEGDADFLILERKIICTGSRSIRDVQAAMKSLKAELGRAGAKVEFV
jgi:transcription initiation factor TFIID TATA-box-binding protein